MTTENAQLPGEPLAFLELDGRPITLYEESSQLPDNPAKLAACQQHLAAGMGGALVGEFLMAGCDFSEGDVRFQLSCSGLSRFGRRCRLTLTQHDEDGNTLSRGGYR